MISHRLKWDPYLQITSVGEGRKQGRKKGRRNMMDGGSTEDVRHEEWENKKII